MSIFVTVSGSVEQHYNFSKQHIDLIFSRIPAPASLANTIEVMTVRAISSASERDVLSLLHPIHAVLNECW
ncbi:hypothetical protein [Nitrosomonas oligotropha]|uniref:hypothetical protein n=1 Tax=Nitrosomonas oligotropha TaxID=42354 RepID=UPI0011600443|nr:hypothetical protein [Nitrosomonas oligotropha]